ncbi:hypothetical protein METBIDRAFT_72613 [Metschnikowia bicuspidata var. bicuspidata NRRL YB-4993]|uniref:Zn(2)-C6 fungal-type domain-containing protein n=1 Tax=Metschnikowia bicuspidata var. bicuspidata NRRL YB-4993 TaxID=869754 RepID=A0A1A0H787_9ASCO|nr:hypothetical protein METBIDRAFT_72613 [Metschnikowia bicuspidata var. bicuspidata NRRL YB-4993]OBA19891.1 hypothetical protein METBIDRAFT_72613 [Metschnikowia bicuspidata var. bicuspidata NRRL YB-4993]
MLPDDPEPAPQIKERRSRRSHKNSKDGCPNCRANRVKCSEDLPSCLQCTKKNYRCGYLDFPPKKLEHIRRKNEMLRPQVSLIPEPPGPTPAVSTAVVQHDPVPFYASYGAVTHQLVAATQTHELLGAPPLYPHGQATGPNESHDEVFFQPSTRVVDGLPYIPIKIREAAPHVRRAASTVLPNVRSVLYSNAFLEITHDLGPLEEHIPSELESQEKGLLLALDQYDTHLAASYNVPLTQRDSHPNGRTTASVWEETFIDSPNDKHDVSMQDTSCPKVPTTGTASTNDKFLPNCEFQPTKFEILQVPQELQTNLFEQTVKDLKQTGAHIRLKSTVKSNFMRPVYHEREFRTLWLEVFLRATVFEFFFIYFIDKSINILMRASEKIVDGDVVFSPQLDSSRSSSVSGLGATEAKLLHFFYNKEDLDILTAKSYVTFGRVIAELRNSISLYSPEFPARMSLFSAWACFTNPQSNLDTFSLMIRGTLILFKNSLTECISQNLPIFSMHREFLLCENFLRQSLNPDYNFSVVRNLQIDFQKYKSYVDELVNLHEKGTDLDQGLVSVIYDPIFRHDFHELNKIFDKLLKQYFPEISAQNLYYKAQNNYEKNDNIHFVSPSLLFNMAYEWFYLYPDEKMYMSSKTNPLKKIMYMFYHALAKCLNHVISPLKSVLLADSCNVTCTKVGTDLSKPDLLDTQNYCSLLPILRNLMRIIRFFETRLQLLAYHNYKTSVINDEFIREVPSDPDQSWEYSDVIEILPAKLKLREKQIENFSNTIFAAHHYPLFDELYSDPVIADMIHLETKRQHYSMQNEPYSFNYSVGLANHDFNPDKIVDLYCSQKKDELDRLPPIPHEQLNIRLDNLLSSRDAISNSSKNQSESAKEIQRQKFADCTKRKTYQ